MELILHGDIDNAQQTTLDDVNSIEATKAVTELYRKTQRMSIGYQRLITGSGIWYYAEKIGARGSGYISCNYHRPNAVENSCWTLFNDADIRFHTKSEFDRGIRNGSIHLIVYDDYRLPKDEYQSVINMLLYAIYNRKPIRMVIPIQGGVEKALQVELLQRAGRILLVMPTELRKRISYSASLDVGTNKEYTCVFEMYAKNESGFDNRMNASYDKYSAYLANLIYGTPKDSEWEALAEDIIRSHQAEASELAYLYASLYHLYCLKKNGAGVHELKNVEEAVLCYSQYIDEKKLTEYLYPQQVIQEREAVPTSSVQERTSAREQPELHSASTQEYHNSAVKAPHQMPNVKDCKQTTVVSKQELPYSEPVQKRIMKSVAITNSAVTALKCGVPSLAFLILLYLIHAQSPILALCTAVVVLAMLLLIITENPKNFSGGKRNEKKK